MSKFLLFLLSSFVLHSQKKQFCVVKGVLGKNSSVYELNKQGSLTKRERRNTSRSIGSSIAKRVRSSIAKRVRSSIAKRLAEGIAKGRSNRMNNNMDNNKEAIVEMGLQNLVRSNNSNVSLSLNNYSKNIKDSRSNTKLVKSNVISIFSFALKYMNKKSLNKWLRNNVKAPFCDTFVPHNKPLAYIKFKCSEDMKIFEKLIENKRFHPNDSLSTIKIYKFSKYSQKRKGSAEDSQVNRGSRDTGKNIGHNYGSNISGSESNNLSKDKHERKKQKVESSFNHDVKREEDNEEELLDLQSIMKLNRTQKYKSIENYVTPFYKYSYSDQIKIKHKFLEKCKDQILSNLKSKWMKQSLLFGDLESSLVEEELNLSNGCTNAGSGMTVHGNPRSGYKCYSNISSNNGTNNNGTVCGGKKNKKNETSKDSCLNKTVLSDIKMNNNNYREISLEKKMEEYDFEIDSPLYPDEKGINSYRNKCEFTISYDENNNVEIGFVTGKIRTYLNDNNEDKILNDDNNCNFSENNISNSASPINESHSTKLRNKKQKQSYYLNPIVKNVDDCIHIHPCMKQVVNEMKNIIKVSSYPVFDRVYKTGVWRLLVVRFNSRNELMITVQTYTLDQKKKKEIKKLLINRLTKKKDEAFMSFCNFKVVSLYLQEHDKSNDSSDQSPNEHLWGVEYLEEIILNNRFFLTPSCFFQVNHSSCEILYKQVINYINIDKKKKNYIFDLCCGTGTISICAANEIKEGDVHIIGIDICEESIISAKKNAEINKINQYKFIQGRVEELFASEIKNISEKNVNIIVIVDPPRSGLSNSVLNILSSNQLINQIIYVSCNPITLINNITNVLFLNENLKIKNLVFVDMFPHTFHLECITNVMKV
ncbi:RNA (uracil-5-)methyltransferase, putative [Plasmodium malariae]|uniref:RNA (Uracil-5-)methyltransferase, putative n=1 Tax=Plasmodium malariae TaxID=5858 RepID=A0A1D3PCY1_PLAMA|nr:RNA (uracil-5-)methyltransferase, putative [Plasmodium malariae]SCN12855.1 RNA (uracil-5-)methyltransferase, putative [Plasmodium malariae]